MLNAVKFSVIRNEMEGSFIFFIKPTNRMDIKHIFMQSEKKIYCVMGYSRTLEFQCFPKIGYEIKVKINIQSRILF